MGSTALVKPIACEDQNLEAELDQERTAPALESQTDDVVTPWDELVGHSAAIVEHTVGAVIAVGQGLVEVDRQFGISTTVVDAVDGIRRRVSANAATIDDSSGNSGDSGVLEPRGSQACAIC